MIRTFVLQIDDTDHGYETPLVVEIDDKMVGLQMEVDGRTYRLDAQAVEDLREILAQVKDD